MHGGKAPEFPETGWVVAEIAVFPLGTGEPSVREYVRALYRIVLESGMKHELTAMGTLLEGRLEDVLALARRLHESCFTVAGGTSRVLTTLRLDERRGEPLTLEGKVRGALEGP